MNNFFFFFSSRRRHTRSLRDWSSDVCSSDLDAGAAPRAYLWIKRVERRMHHSHEDRTKGETNDHRQDESDRHFHDRPAQVFEMLEERFGRFTFRQFAKLENVLQGHVSISAALTK